MNKGFWSPGCLKRCLLGHLPLRGPNYCRSPNCKNKTRQIMLEESATSFVSLGTLNLILSVLFFLQQIFRFIQTSEVSFPIQYYCGVMVCIAGLGPASAHNQPTNFERWFTRQNQCKTGKRLGHWCLGFSNNDSTVSPGRGQCDRLPLVA